MTECGKKSSRTFQQVELVKDQDAHTSIRPGHTQHTYSGKKIHNFVRNPESF